MKKKSGVAVPMLMTMLLVFILAAVVWVFSSGVSQELWMNSIRTVTEHTKQGANAINIQFQDDFAGLSMLEQYLEERRTEELEEIMELCRVVEPDVAMYVPEMGTWSPAASADQTVCQMLSGTNLGHGILDSHISSATGEEVFDIFEGIDLAGGIRAYLVKEYRTEEIAQQFTISFYNHTGFSYLINQEGKIMVRSPHKNSNRAVASLFDMITPVENDRQRVEALKESIHERRSGWDKFYYQENGLVFCYEPLPSNTGWLLVSVVPELEITKQTQSILTKTMMFSGAAVGLIVVIAAIFYGTKLRESWKHTRELQEALDAADTANRAKGQFLMNMSHDILTPLNAVIGMTAIARENIENKVKMQECLKQISVSGKHLLRLVRDVLDMSQLERGKVTLKEEHLNFVTLYQEIIEMTTFLAQESGLILESMPIQVQNAVVLGDSLRIRQVLINIITNAINYTKQGGKITLELTQAAEYIDGYGSYRFCCTDTGIGMEQEVLDKIFLSFERDKNTTISGISGIGAGLAITKGLLELMGGSISVKSELGKGSAFTVEFRFQVQENDLQQATFAESEQESSVDREIDYSEKHILLVEDVEINMEIAEELLSVLGVQIDKAYNGQEAVEMVRKQPVGYYDLIFMDIQMPVMDGYEATRWIRGMDRADAGTIPIVALSANSLARDIENSQKSGMNGHIPKPIDMSVVEGVLRKYLA